MRRMPFSNKAAVDEEKLVEYLLSESHPVGKSKARFFKNAGYSRANAEALKDELERIAGEAVQGVTKTGFGDKYVIDGRISSPDGT